MDVFRKMFPQIRFPERRFPVASALHDLGLFLPLSRTLANYWRRWLEVTENHVMIAYDITISAHISLKTSY